MCTLGSLLMKGNISENLVTFTFQSQLLHVAESSLAKIKCELVYDIENDVIPLNHLKWLVFNVATSIERSKQHAHF